ncbi:Gfo/Idh/MocA family oxidoreductase [Micromonospora sp. NPDC047557]|uniref:Gfo/Idh/MocA family oxidoreductase n=1 Tax=Micromonospora sp. NPDC047557 TaxID=3364250 RepID=UPI003723A502
MKQIVQSVSGGELRVVEVPQPEPGATEVLVATRRSLLSAGTERAVRELASASLLRKARARPDLVRQVVNRARTGGVRSTLAAVRSRLDEDMPLGYSAAGVVVTAGASTDGLRPGMRVATASAGHAEYQTVPGLLAVPVPDAVSDQAAAFGAVAAIALQGLRQAEVGLGGSVAVVGLGLVGQLTVRLALASGLTVVGVDLRGWTAELASGAGAVGLVEAGAATTEQVMELTRGRGVDAVLITAATASSEPVARSAEIARDRARLVVVGDVGLDLDRRRFYERELDLRFARSYGPGRYDRAYEEWGVDYPIGHVRWTARRNVEAYLDLVASGRVVVDDMVTHVFDVEHATSAYEVLASDPRSLAVQLTYSAPAQPTSRAVTIRPRRQSTSPRAGLIGAGTYAKATFLPALKAAGWGDDLVAITSAKGLSARHAAERNGIAVVAPTVDDLLVRDDVDVVFILSRHDSHAELAVRALDAGKHVFVEKPLALTQDELDDVLAAYDRNPGHLFVGFNRRHAPMVAYTRKVLTAGSGPITIAYRVNAGRLPDAHWYHDRRQGGRVRGEVCHFMDLASWLVGEQPRAVHAYGSGRGEPGLEEDVSVLLGYPDGSTATITYSTGGHRRTPKERLEVLGRGHTVLIDDFRRLEIDGREIKRVPGGKGHQEQLAHVRAVIAGNAPYQRGFEASIGTTGAALSAIAALAGIPEHPTRLPTQVDAESGVNAGLTS